MIHIPRTTHPPASWEQVAQAATTAAESEQGDHKADDSVYADDQLRATLETLFQDKCAFCEYALGEEWDVEHYRPKGRVAESANHPGYYWLAYEWTNLLPCCKHCNQRRRDKPITDDLRTLPAAGKADQFPLRDEGQRAHSHTDNLAAEEPLLLNPCVDRPEEHLAYTATGEVLSVSKSDRGDATIKICNLNRRRQKRFRCHVLERLFRRLAELQALRQVGMPAEIAALTQAISHNYLAGDCFYAGMARYVLSDIDAFFPAP
jgi:uncharacterized protein (TIGR02646 family)